MKIQGIVVPMVTPLLPGGRLDRDSLGQHIEYLIKGGVAAVFVLGTTGEGPALSRELQKEVIRQTVMAVAGRIPVLAGVSGASVYDSMELGVFARDNGASGIVAAAPCYFPLDEDGVMRYFDILSTHTGLPVYLYNMPSMTKIYFKPELVIRLSKMSGIAGYKDSSGDMNGFQTVLSNLKNRDDFSVFIGPDALLAQAVLFGGSGGVNSGANLFPGTYVGCFKAAMEGNLETCRMFKQRIDDIQSIYNWGSNISCSVLAALKTGLKRKGIIGTNTLAEPAVPISAEIEKMLEERLEKLDAY